MKRIYSHLRSRSAVVLSQSLPPLPSSSLRHHHHHHYLHLHQKQQLAARFVIPSSSSKAPSEGMDDLTTRKCVPCNSKEIWPMSEQSAHELLEKIQGWSLVNEDGILKLHRSWKVKSFTKGLEFFQLVAEVAEAEGHHPDLHLVCWNNVKIDIWTHSVGGLTENDFILAAKINSLHVAQLVRNKAAD